MNARVLMWGLFAASSLSTWDLPPIVGLRPTGWVWALIAAGLLIFALRNLADLAEIADYVLFLMFGVASLMWLDSPPRRATVQDIAQLGAPLIPWMVARYLPVGSAPPGEVEDPARPPAATLGPLILCIFLTAFPLVLQEATGIKWVQSNGRPGAMTMLIVGACALGLVAGGERRAWLGAALAFGFPVLTGSRMATFTILGMAVAMPTRQRSAWRRAALIGGVLAVTVATFTSSTFQDRFFPERGADKGSVSDLVEGDMDTAGRSALWPVLWNKAIDRPFAGRGAGCATYECVNNGGASGHPHNDYLRIFFDYGLIGSALIWLFFLRHLLRSYRLVRRGGPRQFTVNVQVMLALVAVFSASITDGPLFYTSNFMYLVFFLLGTSRRVEREGG